MCADSAPVGWTGPVQLYEGTALPPPCPPSTSVELQGGTGLAASPATCSTCTCGAPVGVTCSDPTVTLYTDSTCGGASCAMGTVGATCGLLKTPTQCNIAGTFVYVSVSGTPATGGSCPPSPEMPNVPPASFLTNALACAPVGTAPACAAGKECTPSPLAPFDLCIYQPGDVACPAGPYPNKSLIDTSVIDTRTCTACTCSAPGSDCTGGVVVVTPNAACSSGVGNPAPVACKFDGIPGMFAYYARVATAPTPSGCTAGGGMPAGTALPGGPVTLCCQ